MNESTLWNEINEYLDRASERGEQWDARWITHAIISSHGDGLSESNEADFFKHAAYIGVRPEVRRAISKRTGGEDIEKADRGQISLPGFAREHLQDYYLVRRDGEDIGIPVTQMSDTELEKKAVQYRAMAASCYAHADELDRFRVWRKAAA